MLTILVRTDARLDMVFDTALPSALKAKLAIHVCDEQFDFNDAAYNQVLSGFNRYRWTNTSLDWSSETTRTLYLSVPAPTAPTVANPIPNQTATAGTSFSYQFPLTTFHDVNGDTLTYTATKADGNDLPTWLGFTATTRTFLGTPQAADVETLAVKVTASDGTASVSDEFNIGVSADTTAPTLVGAKVIVSGTYAVLEFSENLDVSNLPPASAFAVDGTDAMIDEVAWRSIFDENQLVVTFASNILQGETVVMTYTDPTNGDDANAIQDASGNDTATFTTGVNSVPAVTNNSIITNNAPTVANAIPDQAATVGTAFSYQFPLNTFHDADTGSTLTYTATKADGNDLPTWLGFTTGVNSVPDVVNNSTAVAGDTTPPTLSRAVVNQSGLFVELAFSENMDRSNLPPDTAVTITADGSNLAVTDFRVARIGLDRYWLVVAPAIRQGETVIITYTNPTANDDANAFQDTSGNDAASFTTGENSVPGVTNNSTRTNTAPTAANGTVTAKPDTNYTFSAGNFNFADPDMDPLTSVKIVTLPTAGTLSLSGAPIPSGDLPKTVTASDLSARRLQYAPPTGQSGNALASFTFRVNDGRSDSSDAYTLTINVAQNTPPVSKDHTVMTRQDAQYSFFISDFNYSDADGDWQGWNVKILTLPSKGTLKHDTRSISAGYEMHWTDLGRQALKYDPPAGESGAGLGSFTFKVNDRRADSIATYTMTVDVAASGSAQPETEHCDTSDTNELWCATITVGDEGGGYYGYGILGFNGSIAPSNRFNHGSHIVRVDRLVYGGKQQTIVLRHRVWHPDGRQTVCSAPATSSWSSEPAHQSGPWTSSIQGWRGISDSETTV